MNSATQTTVVTPGLDFCNGSLKSHETMHKKYLGSLSALDESFKLWDLAMISGMLHVTVQDHSKPQWPRRNQDLWSCTPDKKTHVIDQETQIIGFRVDNDQYFPAVCGIRFS